MAAEGNSEREVRQHHNSYGLFVGLMKWGTIISAIVALLVVFMISN